MKFKDYGRYYFFNSPLRFAPKGLGVGCNAAFGLRPILHYVRCLRRTKGLFLIGFLWKLSVTSLPLAFGSLKVGAFAPTAPKTNLVQKTRKPKTPPLCHKHRREETGEQMTPLFLSLFLQEAHAAEDPVLETATAEMNRIYEFLQTQEKPAYWIGLGIHEVQNLMLQASNGASSTPDLEHRRHLDIDLRVGDYQLDNTHSIIDGSYFEEPTHFDYRFPISNDEKSIIDALYFGLDDAYRASLRRLIKIESNSNLKVEREDKSDDFSKAAPLSHLEEVTELVAPIEKWQPILDQCSLLFTAQDNIFDSMVSLNAQQTIRWFISTEGTQVREVRNHYRLSVMSRTIADDGMKLISYEYVDLSDPKRVDLTETCSELANQSIDKINELRDAPLIDPYVAPAILHGRAAAVFFHEILGHRVEGSRLKDENDGQTLTDKIGVQIFPEFIQIADDPTIAHYADQDLNGHYRVDDEGVKAQRVQIVEDGELKQFLMSRSPIEGFSDSNGHGRREMGLAPVARQGNLFVSSSKSVSYPELKKRLIEEIKIQDKEFGLIFDDISGGFTFTGRTTPNSYVVKPVTVWKIYPDGREEMVRGVDMIGTPLLTFSRIIATSDREQVFNGSCGAESGWVPVSAIAPDILVKEVEVQRRHKSNDRPPILSKPVDEKEASK